ncbi:MAG: hypothetical protein RIC89_06235 [Pseudomonadales bacterium]
MIAIVNVTVLPMLGDYRLDHQTVMIQSGRVSFLRSVSEVVVVSHAGQVEREAPTPSAIDHATPSVSNLKTAVQGVAMEGLAEYTDPQTILTEHRVV